MNAVGTWSQRRNIGTAGAQFLRGILELYGFEVVPFGQENYIDEKTHAAIRFTNDDLTVRAVRFAPDLLAIRFGKAIYFESKVNTTPNTPNFAIEKACYDELMARHQKGENCVVAFMETDTTWHANWVEQLYVNRDMSLNRKFARGSTTPYLLISKKSTLPLNDFLLLLTPGI